MPVGMSDVAAARMYGNKYLAKRRVLLPASSSGSANGSHDIYVNVRLKLLSLTR